MPSVQFKVAIPPAQLKRLESLLDPKQVKQALFQAVKRTADTIKSIEVDSIVEHSEMTRHAALGAVNTIIPRGDVPEGWVVVSGKGVPIIGFRPSFSQSGMHVTAGGTSHDMPHVFKATMKGMTKSGNNFSHTGAFYRARVATPAVPEPARNIDQNIMVAGLQKNGSLKDRGGIFLRDRVSNLTPRTSGVAAGFAERLPIHQVFGPSAAEFADKQQIETEVKERLGDVMQKNLDSQVDRFLKDAK
jgi:hypothetical protein